MTHHINSKAVSYVILREQQNFQHHPKWDVIGGKNMLSMKQLGRPSKDCNIGVFSTTIKPIYQDNPYTQVGSSLVFVCRLLADTNLRKLIHAIINYPSRKPDSALQAFWATHGSDYPSLWHYGGGDVPADKYPSFIVGRCSFATHKSALCANQLQWSRQRINRLSITFAYTGILT